MSELTRAEPLDVYCPRCLAVRDEPCFVYQADGEKKDLPALSPHLERRKLAERTRFP